MKQLYYLVLRNCSLFRKNQKNVVLCFVAILIVFGLYIIFLRDFMIQSVETSGLIRTSVHEFTDRLMLSGLLIVVNTTTCFGIMQLCIHDTEVGIRKDYLIAPIRKMQLLFGYWITSIIVSFLYTCLAFFGVLIFCKVQYQMSMNLLRCLQCILLLFISSILNSQLLLCIITFIKDTTTFSTFGNLYGMLVGFLAVTYLPYELYPKWLKQVLIYYPPTHLTSFLRQCFVDGFEQTSGNGKKLCQYIYQIYGVRLIYKTQICEGNQHILFLLVAFAILLLFLGIVHKES